MLNKLVRLPSRLWRAIMAFKELAIAIGSIAVGTILVYFLPIGLGIKVCIGIGLFAIILFVWGDRIAKTVYEAKAKPPECQINDVDYSNLRGSRYIKIQIEYVNKSCAIKLQNINLSISYISIVFGTAVYLGKDSLIINERLKRGESKTLELFWGIVGDEFRNDVIGASTQSIQIPLKFSVICSIEASFFKIPILYQREITYSSIPNYQ